jgi:hypothetical protein
MMADPPVCLAFVADAIFMLNEFFPLYFRHFVGLLEKHWTAGALCHLNISTICTPLAVKSSKSSTMVMKVMSAPLPLSETHM